MNNSAQSRREWRGPALFSHGFRPFFLGAACWALMAMFAWLAMLSGRFELPTALDPVSWHAHEFLFGYLFAVIAGFLLTAVPNWTGRLPIMGLPLAGLFLAWVAGRLAISYSALLPVWTVLAADLLMPVLLTAAVTREILISGNTRNLAVAAMLALLATAMLLFDAAALGMLPQAGHPVDAIGFRLGIGTAIMLIALIGGRVVPSFTRNWLARRRPDSLPAAAGTFDRVSLIALAFTLLAWAAWPHSVIAGVLLVLAGLLHLARLGRWAGLHGLAEPLVLVLHIAYLFVPLGALAVGGAILFPGILGPAGALHVWMAGAVGLMTLAIMTRTTLGHTGRKLHAGPGTTTIYLLVVAAVAARFCAAMLPSAAGLLHTISGLAWMGAFLLFILAYGPLLLRPRQ